MERNYNHQKKEAFGTAWGAAAGGILGGPAGAVIGGFLGNRIVANIPSRTERIAARNFAQIQSSTTTHIPSHSHGQSNVPKPPFNGQNTNVQWHGKERMLEVPNQLIADAEKRGSRCIDKLKEEIKQSQNPTQQTIQKESSLSQKMEQNLSHISCGHQIGGSNIGSNKVSKLYQNQKELHQLGTLPEGFSKKELQERIFLYKKSVNQLKSASEKYRNSAENFRPKQEKLREQMQERYQVEETDREMHQKCKQIEKQYLHAKEHILEIGESQKKKNDQRKDPFFMTDVIKKNFSSVEKKLQVDVKEVEEYKKQWAVDREKKDGLKKISVEIIDAIAPSSQSKVTIDPQIHRQAEEYAHYWCMQNLDTTDLKTQRKAFEQCYNSHYQKLLATSSKENRDRENWYQYAYSEEQPNIQISTDPLFPFQMPNKEEWNFQKEAAKGVGEGVIEIVKGTAQLVGKAIELSEKCKRNVEIIEAPNLGNSTLFAARKWEAQKELHDIQTDAGKKITAVAQHFQGGVDELFQRHWREAGEVFLPSITHLCTESNRLTPRELGRIIPGIALESSLVYGIAKFTYHGAQTAGKVACQGTHIAREGVLVAEEVSTQLAKQIYPLTTKVERYFDTLAQIGHGSLDTLQENLHAFTNFYKKPPTGLVPVWSIQPNGTIALTFPKRHFPEWQPPNVLYMGRNAPKTRGMPEYQLTPVGRKGLTFAEVRKLEIFDRQRNAFLKALREAEEWDLSSMSKKQQDLVKKWMKNTKNAVKRHMKADDLAACIKESRGEKILKTTGESYDHLKEVADSRQSLQNALDSIPKIAEYELTPECKRLRSKWSNLLDTAEKIVERKVWANIKKKMERQKKDLRK